QFLEASSSHSILALGRLVRIGSRSNGDVLRTARALTLIGIFPGDVLRQQRRSILLHKDFFLELTAIELHVFVRVTRVAILTGKFASAIRVDGPFERDAVGIAPVQDGAYGQ